MNLRIVLRYLFLAALVLLIPQRDQCVAQDSAREESRSSWKIGAIAALSGAASGWGEMARNGWQLAVDQANAAGGIAGKKVELLVEDSRTDAKGSVAAFKKLHGLDKVDAMVGDVWDFITTPLIPLSNTSTTLLVSTIIDQSTHMRSPYFFTIGPHVDSVAGALDQFFALNRDIKTLGILGWDNDWGYAYEKVWTEAAKRAGVTIVDIQRSVDMADDWRDEVSKIARKKPDAVFFCYQAPVILKRFSEIGMTPKLITTSNITEELENKVMPAALTEGVYYTDWKASEQFIEEFKAKFNKAPLLNASDAYEAMRSVLKALAAHSKDPKSGMTQVDYQGVTGPINFSKVHDGNFATAQLYRISNGVGVLVE